MMMKVLLTTLNSKYIHQNLAIGLLYHLNRDYRGLNIKEFATKMPVEEVADYCSSFDLIAFSCYIWNIEKTLEVAKQIKHNNPSCKILLGGPEVSYEYYDVIELPYVDFIIVDEGEISFSVFLKKYPELNSIPGLVWKKDGEIISNELPEPFDLNSLKGINPYLHIPKDELKNKVCYVEASRGCPNRCSFCLAGLQNRLRYMPMDYIHGSLRYLMENGRTIKFLDRTFNANQKFAISIFQFILDNRRPSNVFQFEIKADIAQNELIEFVCNKVPKGVFRFEIGIQTLNDRANDAVHRRQNFENIKSFVRRVSERVEVHLDLIVGLPYDYYDDIKYTFEEVFKLFAPELQLGFLKFLKGTPIRKDYKQHGYRFQQHPPYQVLESKYLSANEIKQIEHVEHALDLFWNKKRAINTLRYVARKYSIFQFLKGLGEIWLKTYSHKNVGLVSLYNTLFHFSKSNYPDDVILIELITLDYYLSHKIKPASRFIPEIEKQQRITLYDKLGLNHHKYRYAFHPVHFDVKHLLQNNDVRFKTDILVVEFNGIDYPKVVV